MIATNLLRKISCNNSDFTYLSNCYTTLYVKEVQPSKMKIDQIKERLIITKILLIHESDYKISTHSWELGETPDKYYNFQVKIDFDKFAHDVSNLKKIK